MNLNFINLGRAFFGLLAELACNVKSMNRKYKLANRLRGPWPKGPFLWMHGASMGECKMLLNLAYALKKDIPDLPKILLTTQKVEVLQYLQESQKQDRGTTGSTEEKLQFALAPADTPWTLKKFLCRAQPVGLILGENELWPGYLSSMQSFTRSPSVALVSGRFKRALPGVDFSGLGFATMQTVADQSRFLKFSARSFRAPISVGGNWKLLAWARENDSGQVLSGDDSFLNSHRRIFDVALLSFHIEETPFLENFISNILRQGKSVVLVPRRLEEVSRFKAALRKFNVQVVTYPQTVPGGVSLVDCFGVVREILSQSKSAVVGGSFRKDLGVHDFWEPLQMGVPTYVGPYCRGHESAVESLIRRGALVRLGLSDQRIQNPADGASVLQVLVQEREKIINSYLQLKKFVEELL